STSAPGPDLNGAHEADGQEDDGAHQFQRAADGDADDAERNEQQPDEGISDEREQGERPAKDEENAEEQEFDHNVPSASSRRPALVDAGRRDCTIYFTQRVGREFPALLCRGVETESFDYRQVRSGYPIDLGDDAEVGLIVPHSPADVI